MWIDSRLEFSDAQAVTADAASTNIIDLTQVARQIGVGRPLWVILSLDVGANDSDSTETYVVNFETDADEAFSDTAILNTQTIVRGAAAGSRYAMSVSPADMERYVRVLYDVGGSVPTMTISAFLTDQEPTFWQSYADADN